MYDALSPAAREKFGRPALRCWSSDEPGSLDEGDVALFISTLPLADLFHRAAAQARRDRGVSSLRRVAGWLHRVVKTGNTLRQDRRVPRVLRGALCLAPFMLAIPGPFDEIVVLVCVGLVALFWRDALIEAWRSHR